MPTSRDDESLRMQIVKSQKGVPLKTRVIPGEAVKAMERKVDSVAEDMQEILAEVSADAALSSCSQS